IAGDGKTIAYIGAGKDCIGLLVFEDKIRPESAELIRRLKVMKIDHILMLTGDAPETAKAVAKRLGIKEFFARLQPDEKLKHIQELAEKRVVMMVGDGINDAPALATARVGVAMGSFGTGVATDAADVVITVENVERVADIIRLGRRMTQVAIQGILFGIGCSVVMMVFAASGYISPTAGALLQEVIDLAAILNAFRAR
ncbi:MAG: HAD-IC family P-type ATPase, partial [Chthonomonadales bacterium]